MGGKGSAPAPPDYSQLAQSSTDAAKIQAQTSADQLNWAKQQYADQAPYTNAFMQSMTTAQNQDLKTQQENAVNAQQAQDYYKNTYQPLEGQFAGEAARYNTPARANQQAAAAEANVAQTMNAQRQGALQSLEGFGIDPSQTRYGALDLGARIQQGAAQAAAGTQSRLNTEGTGLALQGEAINIGRGYPGQVASAYGTSINAGSGASSTGGSGVNAGLSTSNTFGNLMGPASSWSQLSNQSTGLAGNLQNQGFQNSLAGFNSNAAIAQNTASGIGSLVGAGIGVASIAAIGI
jgi:hypothetical protein